jgi:hypothetical protein
MIVRRVVALLKSVEYKKAQHYPCQGQLYAAGQHRATPCTVGLQHRSIPGKGKREVHTISSTIGQSLNYVVQRLRYRSVHIFVT